jgi:hypothetical protein
MPAHLLPAENWCRHDRIVPCFTVGAETVFDSSSRRRQNENKKKARDSKYSWRHEWHHGLTHQGLEGARLVDQDLDRKCRRMPPSYKAGAAKVWPLLATPVLRIRQKALRERNNTKENKIAIIFLHKYSSTDLFLFQQRLNFTDIFF